MRVEDGGLDCCCAARPRVTRSRLVAVVIALLALLATASPGAISQGAGTRLRLHQCLAAPGAGLTLANVAAGDGFVRVVGSNGLVGASRDLSRWRLEPTPLGHNLRGIVWTGARWVAVGDVGSVLHLRGHSWIAVPAVPSSALRGIAARPGLIAASGSDGVILTSRDGVRWRTAASGTSALLWGGTRVGAEIALSGQNATVLDSLNGVVWKPVHTAPLPTGSSIAPRPLLWQLAAARREVVAVGDFGAILHGTLAAGLRGVRSPTTEILRGVTYHAGRWVAVGSGGVVLSSTDRSGGVWHVEFDPTTVDLRGVAWDGTRFVAVGDEGTVISSADGRRWRIDASAMPCALLGVASSGGRLVAVGGTGRIQLSLHGRRWRSVASPTVEDLYGVAHGRGGFVAVGARATVLRSASGLEWAQVAAVPARLNLHAVAWTGNSYLAGGDRGEVISSVDGHHWKRVAFPGFHSVRGFASDGAVVIAVGAGTIARKASVRGRWTLEPVGLGKFQTGVAFGDGRFVIVTHNGGVLVSTDGGVTWSPATSGVTDNFDAIVWTGRRFIATGEGVAIASPDGVSWSPLHVRSAHSLRSLTLSGGAAVAVGDDDTALLISQHAR